MQTKTLFLAVMMATSAAFADHYWKGTGETSDWTDADNWINAIDNGNAVFGGGKFDDYPQDGATVTFSGITVGRRTWIENYDKGITTWDVSENATEGAGWQPSDTGKPSLTVGTGRAGRLTINGGTHKWLSELWIGNGNAENSHLIVNGGDITSGSYTCIGYGGYARTATMTVNGGTYRQTSNQFIVSQGNNSNCIGIFNLTGGEVLVNNGHLYGSENAGQSVINLTGGRLYVKNRILVGHKGPSTMTVEDGATVEWNDQLMAGSETAGAGTIVVNGGVLGKGYYLAQIGLKGSGSYTQNGGVCTCSSFRLGSDATTAVGTANMNGGTLRMSSYLSVGGAGKGTFNLKGGVVETEYVTVGNGAGTLVLDGGTLRAVKDNETFIPVNGNLTVKLGPKGAAFDTAGHAVTVPNALANDAEDEALVGNAPIAKSGLGTLTLSADLDLERTFAFTINEDVGPVALTGAKTLAEGKKMTVKVDPVLVTGGSSYTLMTGLGSLTMDDVELVCDDSYGCVGQIADGTLVITIAHGSSVAVTTKYVDGEWRFYDVEGNLIEGGEMADITTYVFTGAEPKGELEKALATGHAIVLEARTSGGSATTNTIILDADVTLKKVSVETDEGCAVQFASGEGHAVKVTAEDLVNNGTIAFGGTVTFVGLFDAGTFEVAEGAVLHVAKSQRIAAYFTGSGEIVVDNGIKFTIGNTGSGETFRRGTEYFQGFGGTLTIPTGAQLEDLTDLHAENASQGPYYFLGEGTLLKMAGGTVTRFGGATNNEYLKDVVVAEGTTSVWNNYQSRSGWLGVNMNLTGSVTGSGTLKLNVGGRSYRIVSDLHEFGGTIECSGSEHNFRNGVKGATVVFEADAQNSSNSMAIDNATVIFKNKNLRLVDAKGVQYADGAVSVGANARIGTTAATEFQSIVFTAGATLELVDEGALSDVKQTYVALTSATPIVGMPELVGAKTARGKWKLSVVEVKETVDVTDPDSGEVTGSEERVAGYQLVATFKPLGFCIVVL